MACCVGDCHISSPCSLLQTLVKLTSEKSAREDLLGEGGSGPSRCWILRSPFPAFWGEMKLICWAALNHALVSCQPVLGAPFRSHFDHFNLSSSCSSFSAKPGTYDPKTGI